MTRPLFLSLDGIDGTGKSTQVARLANWLQARGRAVVRPADPGSTPLGDKLRDILLFERLDICPMAEALLFMASRAELLARIIRPALSSGANVLCDRYLLANVVYQGYGSGLNIDDLWTIGRISTGGLSPDLTIVLDLTVERAQLRRGRKPDRMEDRQRDFHERVRQGFLLEARKQPDAIRTVDAAGSIEEIHELICKEVEDVLATHSRP